MTLVLEKTFDEIDLPEKVYKYRNWSNVQHKRLLTHNEIYFAPPLDIDEQHECNLETDYDSIKATDIFRFAYNHAAEQGMPEGERIAFAQWTVQTTPYYDLEHRKSMEEKFRQSLNYQLSIFCVSTYRDNINLWSSFAGGHTGFCVGINTRKMFDNKEIFGGGGKVNYYSKEEMPKRKPICFNELERIQDMITVIFSLPKFFEGEKEYRLFKMNLINKQAKISSECIEEVILGQQIKEKDKKEIIEVIKDKLPKASILQANINLNTNTFSFEQIDN